MEEHVNTLLNQMTLDEKVALLAGESAWYTVPIERLNIPRIKVTDGPNGARGEGSSGNRHVTAACFPVGIALAATWNRELVERVGQALGEETESKSAHILLAPTVNIHRSPLNGRNFECYAEDPFLTAQLAVAYIKGLQSQGVGATIKHFVCNDSEFQRNTISSEVDERTLREIYLPPFKAAVHEADVWAVMSSYNRVNGTYTSEHDRLLNGILKGEWGFEGLVISDWNGTYSTSPATNSGLDLEMPGPTRWRGGKLLQAIQAGDVEETTIDDHVRRILRTIIKVGAMESLEILPEQAIDNPAHRALARKAATEAIVLLKNERNILPLDLKQITSIAIIGPNAKVARIMGGGSSQVAAHYRVSPFEGLMSKVGDRAQILYEQGCSNERMFPLLDEKLLTTSSENGGENGLFAEFFDNCELAEAPALTTVVQSTQHIWYDENPLLSTAFSARFTGNLTVPTTGIYQFSLTNHGPTRVFIDDVLVADHWAHTPLPNVLWGPGANSPLFEIQLQAGQTYQLKIEHSQGNFPSHYGFRLGYHPPGTAPSIKRAVELATQANVALIFAGSNSDWESEGSDRPHMDLVGEQNELIERVAAANPNTVVILTTGAPVTMPWLDRVAGVLETWFGGQEAGNAVADVLFGHANPSGKLTQTFPVRLEDNPTFINYPGENGQVRYGEGIFVGYRYYDKKKIVPLFPFGFGLSYTTFEYSNLRLSATEITPDDTLEVMIDVTNTGPRPGQEVIQLYVRDMVSRLQRPHKELKGFAKIALEPGATVTVTLHLDYQSLAYYDDRLQRWIAEVGTFEVLVGSSSADIRAAATFSLITSRMFGGPERSLEVPSIQSALEILLQHQDVRTVLERHLPSLMDMPQLEALKGFSLKQIAQLAPDIITQDVLEAVEHTIAHRASDTVE